MLPQVLTGTIMKNAACIQIYTSTNSYTHCKTPDTNTRQLRDD